MKKNVLEKKYLNSLKKELHVYAERRRDIISHAGDALHHAKRAIFDMQRDDMKEADIKIKKAEALLKGLTKKYAKDSNLIREGALNAGVEEYVEAKLFYAFLSGEKIGRIDTFPIHRDVYLAGLCDLPGELYRYAIRAATRHDAKTVEACAYAAAEIIGVLMEFHLTKYLRNKFDQAKNAVHKLEHVVYELSIRE